DLSLARDFGGALAVALRLPPELVLTAYEDVPKLLWEEAALPVNADPLQADLSNPEERSRLARLLAAGLDRPAGFVLPLKAASPTREQRGAPVWESSPWPLRRERLYAVEGDSPLGLRLPLSSLPKLLPEEEEKEFPADPFSPKPGLPKRGALALRSGRARGAKPREVVKTALTLQ